MVVSNIEGIKPVTMDGDGVKNVLKRVLVGPKEGWESHVMRLFTVGKNGNTPRHKHPWPHINYIVSGEGVLYMDGVEYKVREGYFAFVPSNVEHQYINTGKDDFVFICIVPKEGENI